MEIFVHREFTYESLGETIMKIGPHFQSYFQKSSGLLFLERGVFLLKTACKIVN